MSGNFKPFSRAQASALCNLHQRDAHCGIISQDVLDAEVWIRCATTTNDHARMLRKPHANAAAKMQRHPCRPACDVQHRDQQWPLRHRVRPVFHCLCLAVGRCHRARSRWSHPITTGALSSQVRTISLKARPSLSRSPKPTQHIRASRPWNAMRSRAAVDNKGHSTSQCCSDDQPSHSEF